VYFNVGYGSEPGPFGATRKFWSDRSESCDEFMKFGCLGDSKAVFARQRVLILNLAWQQVATSRH
jgi:hypothetical protein